MKFETYRFPKLFCYIETVSAIFVMRYVIDGFRRGKQWHAVLRARFPERRAGTGLSSAPQSDCRLRTGCQRKAAVKAALCIRSVVELCFHEVVS